MAQKTIQIKCGGTAFVPIEELEDFQGTLKVLSQPNFDKLKKSILDYGFSFPIFVYPSSNKYYILDGHQRIRVLKTLKEEGYSVPDVPIVSIQAKTRREARMKLLAVVSQYGEITLPGFEGFLEQLNIEIDDVKDLVQLPDLDLEKADISDVNIDTFFEENENKPTEAVGTVTCPECGHEFIR